MTRDEENRRLMKWLDPHFCGAGKTQGDSTWGYSCVKCSMSIHEHPGGLYDRRHQVRDFYNNEAANALLLEKMPYVEVTHALDGDDAPTWQAMADWRAGDFVVNQDRKTAIVKAALAYLET